MPVFKYHPDPILSGSVAKSGKKCVSCRQSRGYIYTGPVFCEDALDNCLCPWCIADGSAHTRFAATFIDDAIFPDDVPATVVQEIARRTPGYNSWQSEQWFACCRDAMAFLEPVGLPEIRQRYADLERLVLAEIISTFNLAPPDAKRLLESLKRDPGPTAYIFQCLHCRSYRAFVDGIFEVGI